MSKGITKTVGYTVMLFQVDLRVYYMLRDFKLSTFSKFQKLTTISSSIHLLKRFLFYVQKGAAEG